MKQLIPIFLLAFIFVIGCNSSGDSPPVPDEPQSPQSAALVFPFKDSECEGGADITDEESTVTFEWQKSDYTDSYELTLTNLDSGTMENHSSTRENLSIRLQRGVPYKWYVVSKSNSLEATAKSEV